MTKGLQAKLEHLSGQVEELSGQVKESKEQSLGRDLKIDGIEEKLTTILGMLSPHPQRDLAPIV